jgi:hypothetical protein
LNRPQRRAARFDLAELKGLRVYSTLSGAKSCAKALKAVFDDSGFVFPLHKCQTAVARAGGFRDWRDLTSGLESGSRTVDPPSFRRRLLAALPRACHAPVRAYLDKWVPDPKDDPGDDIPRNWFRDVHPYHLGASVMHRSRTPLLRPGSGAGQRLRLEIVERILNNYRFAFPLMEPETLSFDFHGDLPALFDDLCEHPKFKSEFERLIDAGVLAWTQTEDPDIGTLRVLPPEGLEDKVIRSAIAHARYEGMALEEEGGPRPNLREAINLIGVEGAPQLAEAIRQQGDDAYIAPSGPVQALLSELIAEGAF